MCCCGKPVKNGEMGYRWQPNDSPRVREVNPPDLQPEETLLIDEPGRCGGLDCHSHHYRVTVRWGTYYLAVRHGGGDERHRISNGKALTEAMILKLDSNQRYWILSAMYHMQSDAADRARTTENMRWKTAAADKRIKTRKLPARGLVKVWIEPAKGEISATA